MPLLPPDKYIRIQKGPIIEKKKTIEDFVLPVKTAASHVCVYNHTSWSNRRCCLQNGLCGLLFKAD